MIDYTKNLIKSFLFAFIVWLFTLVYYSNMAMSVINFVFILIFSLISSLIVEVWYYYFELRKLNKNSKRKELNTIKH